MERRTLLLTLSTLGASAIAGCNGTKGETTTTRTEPSTTKPTQPTTSTRTTTTTRTTTERATTETPTETTRTTTRTTTQTTTIAQENSDIELIKKFREILVKAGYDGVEVYQEEDEPKEGLLSLVVMYQTDSYTSSGMRTEIEGVVSTFIVLIQSGWSGDSMVGVIKSQSGESVGSFYCLTRWAEAYIDGERTFDGVMSDVVETIDT